MGKTNKIQDEKIAEIKKIIEAIRADPKAMAQIKSWMKANGQEEVVMKKKGKKEGKKHGK